VSRFPSTWTIRTPLSPRRLRFEGLDLYVTWAWFVTSRYVSFQVLEIDEKAY
jgi:hypothetical protein